MHEKYIFLAPLFSLKYGVRTPPPTALERQDKTVSDRYAQALYHNNLGAEAIVNSALEEALKQLRIALAIEPELADAWNNMGIVQRKLAIRTLKSAIRLGNNEPEFYRLLHVAYDRTGNSKKSLENLLLANYYQKQKPPDLQQSTIRVISDPEADRFSRVPTIILAPR